MGSNMFLVAFLAAAALPAPVQAEPLSPPYVAYRTDPYSTPPSSGTYQYPLVGDRIPNITLGARPKVGSRGRAKVRPVEVSPASASADDAARRSRDAGVGAAGVGGEGDPRCPLAFRLGLTHRSSSGSGSSAGTGGINGPVVTYPAHPAHGPGRQVIFVESWERLDVLTPSAPSIKDARHGEQEAMEIDEQFPLLFEGANFFHSTPVLHDENGDGVVDVTVIDYDGGVYTVGLDYNPDSAGSSGRKERHVKTAQVPRLYIRRDWVESATNVTKMEEFTNPRDVSGGDEDYSHRYTPDYPPFHSYFEYGLEWKEEHDNARIGVKGGVVSADVLSQSVEDVRKIEEERARRWRDVQDEILGKNNKEEEEKEVDNKGEEKEEETGEEKSEVAKDDLVKEEKGKHDVPELDEGGGDAIRGDRRRRLTEEEKGEGPPAADDGAADNAKTGPSDPVDAESEVVGAAKEEAVPSADDGMDEEKPEVIDAIPVKKKKDKPVAPEVVPDKKVEGEDCGDCYGAGEPDECCSSCAQVVAAYKKKNWGFKKANIAQCVSEGDLEDDDEKLYKQYGDEDYRGGMDDIDPDWRDDDEYLRNRPRDDDKYEPEKYEGDGVDEYMRHGYGYGDDYYPRGDDDYYGDGSPTFYSDENYIRVTPHVLAQPLYVELPKRYKSADDPEWAVEEFLVVPVSYYMDEDEYKGMQSYRRFKNKEGGDETETERGQYVASAILFYNSAYNQWSTQTHLDLSTDWTSPVNTTVGDAPIHDKTYNGYGAFALSSPTVASLGVEEYNNSPKFHVIIGTSMGLLYVLDVPGASRKDGFPVRFPYPIVRRPVVEDVSGDVTPEIIAADSGGNVACFDSSGTTLWHRDVIEGERYNWRVVGTSEISLGDVDGDGNLDVVIIVRLVATEDAKNKKRRMDEIRVYAVEAATGDDLARFPMSIDVPSRGLKDDRGNVADAELPLPQPLLVDLHASQDHWLERIRRNETQDTRSARERDVAEARRINTEAAGAPLPDKNSKIPHGGMGRGLHIVQPIEDFLYIIEGGTGCTQTINVGDTIPSMVQVDDVHGTNALDLIVTTASGQVLTLEASGAVPFHPLNVWNTGPVRSRINGHAQGYSASSGIFVHDRSRTYKNWLGIYVVVTFEIFDRRPSAWKEDADKRKYKVDMRYGTSSKKMMFYKTYDSPGTYTEQVFVPFGPGYYSVTARLTTTHGLVYEDVFSFGYNVNYASGLAWIVLVPLIVASIPLLSIRRQLNWEEDDDFSIGGSGGILG